MGMNQGSVLSPVLFAVVVDVVIELAREVALDLILMSQTIEGLSNEFL